MKTREQRLAEFAQAALEILANDQDWNSETFEQIANLAVEFGLAEADDEGYFCETEEANG